MLRRLARSAVVQWRRRQTTAERYYGQLSDDVLREQFKAALEPANSVPTAVLLTIATLLIPQCRVDIGKRRLAQAHNVQLFAKWRRENKDAHIFAIPPLAIVHYRGAGEGEPYLSISLSASGAPDFSWEPARDLLHRTDAIADRAELWFSTSEERIPHIERAGSLSTQVLAVVGREWRRRVDMRTPNDAPATETFRTEVAGLLPYVREAEDLLKLAATHRAQTEYLRGIGWGALALTVFSALGGAALYHFGLSAATAIALPTGGLGAVISVLQRLTTGSLELDFRAPTSRLRVFGLARPWVGGIFGMVLFALLQSGLAGVAAHVPASDGGQLAYYGMLGFIAGFNERFAQDAVSGTARTVGSNLSSPQDIP